MLRSIIIAVTVLSSLQAFSQTLTVRGLRSPDNVTRTPIALIIRSAGGDVLDSVTGNIADLSKYATSVSASVPIPDLPAHTTYYNVRGQQIFDANPLPPYFIVYTTSYGFTATLTNNHTLLGHTSQKWTPKIAAAPLILTALFEHYEPATSLIEIPQSDSTVVLPIELKPWWHRIQAVQINVSMWYVKMDHKQFTAPSGWTTTSAIEELEYSIGTDATGLGTWTWHPNHITYDYGVANSTKGDTTFLRILVDTMENRIINGIGRWHYESATNYNEHYLEVATMETATSTVTPKLITKVLQRKRLWDFPINIRYINETKYHSPGGPDEQITRIESTGYESGDDFSYVALVIMLFD